MSLMDAKVIRRIGMAISFSILAYGFVAAIADKTGMDLDYYKGFLVASAYFITYFILPPFWERREEAE